MNRQALIVGGTATDLPGVARDLINYKQFFESPLGGAWRSTEIAILTEPTKDDLSARLQKLELVDYSVVIFAGHGHHPKRVGSTVVLLRHDVEMDADELKVGAARHTLILDCCRRLDRQLLEEGILAKAMKRAQEFNPTDCRTYFDRAVQRSDPGLVTLYACGIDESASESPTTGGVYSEAIVAAAKDWSAATTVNTSQYIVLPITEAHDRARDRVRRATGGRQNPDCVYPRTDKHFPFAIVA